MGMGKLNGAEGFTLIELMATLVLLGLVVVGGMQLYFFADRAFNSGSLQADLQADMHWALNRIVEEVRLAHSLVVGRTKDEVLDLGFSGEEGREYALIYTENGSVFLETPAGKQLLLYGQALGTDYELAFQAVSTGSEGAPRVLQIALNTQNPELDFSLKSEVEVLNLRKDGIQGTNGGVILFTKTFAPHEFAEAERIGRRCVYSRYVFNPQAPELLALREFRDELEFNTVGEFISTMYYGLSRVIIAFVDLHPWAETPIKRVFGGAAQLVLRFT